MEVRSCALRGRSSGEWHSSEHYMRLEAGTDVSNCISSVAKDFLVMEIYDD